jgi:transcriptional regulator with XRE-family HTH domain
VEDYRTISKRIRELRRSNCMTQEEVAEKVGISLHHYGEIERGRRTAQIFTLKRIANALGVCLDYLVAGKNQDVSICRMQHIIEMYPPSAWAQVEKVLIAMQPMVAYNAGSPDDEPDEEPEEE